MELTKTDGYEVILEPPETDARYYESTFLEDKMNNTIITERLLIRPILNEDVNEIHKYASDKGITMMMFLPYETVEETKGFVEYAVSEWNKSNPSVREYVIVFNNNIIGGISLENEEQKNSYEIGWTIHRDYRNSGFATEAAKAILQYAFDELSAERVIAHCDSKNTASEMVMKKLSMKLIDDSGKRYYQKTGVSSGELLYEIRSLTR